MGARLIGGVGDLARDLEGIAAKSAAELPAVVHQDVEQGKGLARGFAKKASGRHGKAYFKRITSEMNGRLEGEYGPTGDVVGNAVGAGWRHGQRNTDLPKSLDIQGPKFAADVGKRVDSWFW